ncbi:MAG: hypothetical protein M3O50_18000, partial [Myxococcota bacterium]|nr:hypothetical protein [Myxococcota bacterium]
LWLVPGETLCDLMFGRANDASDRKFAAMDFPHANAALPMHFWGAAPCPEGGIYLVFERTDGAGIKIVHLDRAGTMAMVPLLPEGHFTSTEGHVPTEIPIVCVQDNGTDALWTVEPSDLKAQRVASGTAASNQKVQLDAPLGVGHHVAPWPGRGFVVEDDHAATVAGYSIDGQRQFTIPRADLMDADANIEALQALPEGQFVTVTWTSGAEKPTSVKFDAAGRVIERVTMPELGGLPGGLVSFADGRWWVWETVSGTPSARLANVSVQIAGRTDTALTGKLRAQFPFALLPLERSRDTYARWAAFPSGTGNLLVGYSEPSHTPPQPNPTPWHDPEWPPDMLAHFYLIEFASDSTIVHQQRVF